MHVIRQFFIEHLIFITPSHVQVQNPPPHNLLSSDSAVDLPLFSCFPPMPFICYKQTKFSVVPLLNLRSVKFHSKLNPFCIRVVELLHLLA
jgi:hypothetical protein